jgi:hypothetical protein
MGNSNIVINNHCYSGNSEIRHVTIPENVLEIGVGAFSDCVNLETVILNNGLTRLKKEVFSGCRSLREINIPDSLESIGEWAFRGCTGLEELYIPEGVTDICEESFLGCSGLTIIADEGSFAAGYARRTGIHLRIPEK